jgi:hypothetical protein
MTEQLWVPQLNAENLSRRLLTFSSLEDKWLLQVKGKFILKSAMQNQLPAILNFKK